MVGETGSGKTSQLPQYIYEEFIQSNGRQKGEKKRKKEMKKGEIIKLMGKEGDGKKETEKKGDDQVSKGEDGADEISSSEYNSRGKQSGAIACTQPRRVAAISIATRVSTEQGCKLGDTVGYTVRFDDCSSHRTNIKYITDGMLLRELIVDPWLQRYNYVILDEVHERTLHTDVLLGLLKQLQNKRANLEWNITGKIAATNTASSSSSSSSGPSSSSFPCPPPLLPPLKLVCMSATLSSSTFSSYFNSAPIIHISGRQYPVTMYYTPTPQLDYVDSVVTTTIQCHLNQPIEGDILVFLTGQEEIENVKRMIEEKRKLIPPDKGDIVVLPIYAALPSEQQLLVFSPRPSRQTRKIILATNIAETSLTISGIHYVIDSGMTKVRSYNAKSGMEMLTVQPISQAEAEQRAGRAGRQCAGVCYRLYTEESFQHLASSIQPEILRANLASVVLQLKALHVSNLLQFDFLSPPSRSSLTFSLEHLLLLQSLDSSGTLTSLGSLMVQFPLSPHYAKCIIMSSKEEFSCSLEMIIIISMLSVETLFFVPRNETGKEKGGAANGQTKLLLAKKKFEGKYGDLLTLLEIYLAYEKSTNKYEFCQQHCINAKSMLKVKQIHEQLTQLCLRLELPLLSCRNSVDLNTTVSSSSSSSNSSSRSGESKATHVTIGDYSSLRRCLVLGLFLNAARRQSDGSYLTLTDKTQVWIHPTSVLFRSSSLHRSKFDLDSKSSHTRLISNHTNSNDDVVDCVLYNELVLTSKKYLRDVVVIDLAWLHELVPQYYSEGVIQGIRMDGKGRLSSAGVERLAGIKGKRGRELVEEKGVSFTVKRQPAESSATDHRFHSQNKHRQFQ